MFRWEVQMKALGMVSITERVIVQAKDIGSACLAALKQAGDEFEVYSINRIWD